MNEIPLSAIANGRSYEEILYETQRIFTDASTAAIARGSNGDNITSDAIALTAYRLYLMGVADGMEIRA